MTLNIPTSKMDYCEVSATKCDVCKKSLEHTLCDNLIVRYYAYVYGPINLCQTCFMKDQREKFYKLMGEFQGFLPQ